MTKLYGIKQTHYLDMDLEVNIYGNMWPMSRKDMYGTPAYKTYKKERAITYAIPKFRRYKDPVLHELYKTAKERDLYLDQIQKRSYLGQGIAIGEGTRMGICPPVLVPINILTKKLSNDVEFRLYYPIGKYKQKDALAYREELFEVIKLLALGKKKDWTKIADVLGEHYGNNERFLSFFSSYEEDYGNIVAAQLM